MSLVPAGLITSRAQQEHGKRTLACCVHARRRTLFMVAGQVVDEIDLRDGTLIYRIISDLADPIVRLEVTTSDRGHEYLLLLSATSELRIWDIENRFHLAGVSLSNPPRALRTKNVAGVLPPVATWNVTNGHGRCLVLYARTGSAHVEALHVQRQVDRPGSHTIIGVVEARGATARTSCVTAIAAHTSGGLPLLACGSSDGIVSVFHCPWFSDKEEVAAAGGGLGATAQSSASSSAAPAAPPPTDGDEDEGLGPGPDKAGQAHQAKGKAAAGDKAGQPQQQEHASVRSTLLFAAAVSPDIIAVGGKLRKQSVIAAAQAAMAAGQTPAAAGIVTESYYDMVSALAWHPTLPVLAAADGFGRIVLWRVGVADGQHSVMASRDWCSPPLQDDTPRIITSLTLHPTLPRLTSLAYSPQSPSETPVVSVWCTAHANLPPMPGAVSPALAAHMEAAAQDMGQQTVAHLTQAPCLMSGSLSRCPVVWLSGRAIPCYEVATGCNSIGDDEEQDGGMELQASGRDGAPAVDPSLVSPLVPVGSAGVLYGCPVAEPVSAPRCWFVTGGEGEGDDNPGEDTEGQDGAGAGKDDDLNSGSLAEFAARLANSGSGAGKTKGEAGDKDGASSTALTKHGLPKRKALPDMQLSVDAVMYVQSRTTAAVDPPRLGLQHSLHVRPLGQAVGGADDSASAATGQTGKKGQEGVPLSKRLCWLPSYGPGGPLIPLSLTRSPSGRYVLVKFAYLTGVRPGKVQDAGAQQAEQAVLATFKQAQSVLHAAGPKWKGLGKRDKAADEAIARADTAEGEGAHGMHGQPGAALGRDNGAVGSPSDTVLFVVVGPLTDAVDPDTGLPTDTKQPGQEGPMSFSALSRLPTDVPVRPLAAAVDATLLSGDRLLLVRRPLHSIVGGAASTEHTVSIEALDPDYEALAREAEAARAGHGKEKSKVERDLERLGQAIKASAEKDFAKVKDTFDHLGEAMKAGAERDLKNIQRFFGVKNKDGKDGGGKEGKGKEGQAGAAVEGPTKDVTADGAGEGAAAPAPSGPKPRARRYPKPVRFALHDPVASVFPTPFHCPVATSTWQDEEEGEHRPASATEHPASGNVLLFATRWRHPDDDGVPSKERIVLRYSNAAFGQYEESNPHGYALVDAYGPTAPPSLAKGWREEATLEAHPIGHHHHGHGGRDRSNTGQSGEGLARTRSSSNALAKQPSAVSMSLDKDRDRASVGSGHALEEAWAEHEMAVSRCPVTVRPALVLAPGEGVVKVTWQAREQVWADEGVHDEGAEAVVGASKGKAQASTAALTSKHSALPPLPPGKGLPAPGQAAKSGPSSTGKAADTSAPAHVRKAQRLTLPQAIASGGPLVAILTTKRLLIVTPALHMLVALPAMAPVGSAVGVGLGHATQAWGGQGNPATAALACAHFGVWRGMFSNPSGHGHGHGASSLSQAAQMSSLRAAPLPEEGEDEQEEDEDGASGTGEGGRSGPLQVAIGAGYVGVVDARADLPATSYLSGQQHHGAAVVARQARDSSPALPLASPQFGVPASGLAPPDASATFSGGVQVNTVASAAAGAERMTSALPVARLSDTLPHDDVGDDVVGAVRWASPVVSHMWAGSALLVITASGDVWYVTPLGRARRAAGMDVGARDAVLVAATADRLVYLSSSPVTGRVQVRTRAFAPAEPLVASVLDHSATRPKPLLALLGGSAGASGQSLEAPAHPVVACLTNTLTMSIVVYKPQEPARGKDKDKGQAKGQAQVVVLTGQAAIAGLALASLARDYCFVRDTVVRYCHPLRHVEQAGKAGAGIPVRKEGPGQSWGISRALVACLEERGLLDLAFYAAQGSPTGVDKGPDGQAPVDASPAQDEGEEVPPAWLAWLDNTGQRKRASVLPFHWRSALAVKRGRMDHAVWSLAGEDPSLASALVSLTKGRTGSGAGLDALADYDPSQVRLPSLASPLAARLRVLGRLLISSAHMRAALLCFDVAGDHAAALAVLCLASAMAVVRVARDGAGRKRRRGLDDDEDQAGQGGDKAGSAHGVEGSMSLADIDSALGALLGPSKDRYPAIALACALHRRAAVDDPSLVQARDKARKAHAKANAKARAGSAGDGDEDGNDDEDDNGSEEEDEEYDVSEDPGLGSGSLLDTLRAALYPPPLDKATRSEALLPIDHSIGASPAQVAAQARRMLELHAITAAPAMAQCPYLPLLDSTTAAIVHAAEEAGKRLAHAAGGQALVVPVPQATVDAKLSLSGVTLDPAPAPALPTRHAPLALDSLQRWMGSVAAGISRAAAGAAGLSGEDGEDEEGGMFGMSLEGMLGLGQGDKDVDPGQAARLSASGKRRLKALPRGTEDAVVGYWRFEKGEQETAGEAVRTRELRKAKGVPPPAQGGLWGFTNGSSGEAVSPWHAQPVPDLSKQGSHGTVLDCLFLVARTKGAAGAAKEVSSSLAQTVAKPKSSEAGDMQAYLRLAWGEHDSPCDPGDAGKVKPPRALVAGIGTVVDPSGGKAVAMVKSVARLHLAKLLQADTVCGQGPAGLEPVPLPQSLRLLSSLLSWSVAVPVHRYSYCDLGVRPWDPVTAAWTWEAWVKPGNPYRGSTGGAARPADGEDGGPAEEEGSSTVGVSLDRDLLLVARAERTGPEVVAYQWQLSMRPDGALAFKAFPTGQGRGGDGPTSALHPGQSLVSSPPAALPAGEWRHVAVVVDGTGAGKDTAGRLKAAGQVVDKHGPGAPGSVPSDSPLPQASVRLFVDGQQVAEGTVASGLPLPLQEDGHGGVTQDHLLLAPDFVGRMAEVRLWAKKRSGTDLTDTRDFHLDLAEVARKARMAISIRPATLPTQAQAPAPAVAVATPTADKGGEADAAGEVKGAGSLAGPPAAGLAAGTGPKKLGGLAAPSGLAGPGLAGPSAGGPRRKPGALGQPKGPGEGTGTPTVADATHAPAPAAVAAVPTDAFDVPSKGTPQAQAAGSGGQGDGWGGADQGATPTLTEPAPVDDDDGGRPRLGLGLGLAKAGGGLGGPGGGGLGAPPAGVGGGKKAALLRARAGAAAPAPAPGPE